MLLAKVSVSLWNIPVRFGRTRLKTSPSSLLCTARTLDSSFPHSSRPLKSTAEYSIGTAHKISSEWLCQLGVQDPDDSARHMISHATRIGYKFSDFTRNRDKLMTKEEIENYLIMCTKRAEHMPVQYIVGNWDFYGLTLQCKPPILIPRPETEELVENILQSGLLQKLKAPRILDIGAGTGAIGLALLSHLPGASCQAIDLNIDAVNLANENARVVLGVDQRRYYCTHSDFRSYVAEYVRKISHARSSQPTTTGTGAATTPSWNDQTFDLIVSNPPYIPKGKIPSLQREIRDFEDHRALDGGMDGLDMVRDLIYLTPMLQLGVVDAHSPNYIHSTGNSHNHRGRNWDSKNNNSDKSRSCSDSCSNDSSDGCKSSISKSKEFELWLEVSEEHPRMIEEWINGGDNGTYKSQKECFIGKWQKEHNIMDVCGLCTTAPAAFISGQTDLSGNPRFVRLKY